MEYLERFLLFEQQRVPIHRKRGGATQSRDRTNVSTRRKRRRWGAGGWRARGRGGSGSGQTYSAVSRAASGRTVSRGGARGARAAAGTRRAAAQAGRAAPSRGGRDFFSMPRFLFLEEQRLGGGGAGSFAETSHTPRCRRCAARSSACSWAPPRDHLGTSRVLSGGLGRSRIISGDISGGLGRSRVISGYLG